MVDHKARTVWTSVKGIQGQGYTVKLCLYNNSNKNCSSIQENKRQFTLQPRMSDHGLEHTQVTLIHIT